MSILRTDYDFFYPLLAIWSAIFPAIGLHTMTRRRQHHTGTFFGSRVEPEFPASQAGEAILRQFHRRIWIWALCIAVACVFFESVPAGMPLFLLGSLMIFAAMFGSIFAGIVAFALAHSRTQREAVVPAEPTIRMASLAASEPKNPWLGVLSGLAMILPLLIPVGTVLILLSHWSQLSAHDASESLTSAGTALAMGFFCSATQWALLFRARSSDWATTARASYRYRIYFALSQAVVFIILSWNMCSLALKLLHSSVPWLRAVSESAESKDEIYVLVAAAVFLCGWQYWMSKQTDRQSSDSMPDSSWKAGHFYCNPGDPALVVPSRTGVGFAMNYGRRSVRLVMAVFLMLFLATMGNLIYTVRSISRDMQATASGVPCDDGSKR